MRRDAYCKTVSAADVALGAAIGAAGGLVGALVMTGFQNAWMKARQAAVDRSSRGESSDGRSQSSNGAEQTEPATVKTADAVATRVLHRHLTSSEKRVAGPVVHYSAGALFGAIYGALCALTPAVRSGAGTAYGAAVWLVSDELVAPALGLGPAPTKAPISTHLYALASHLVYGVGTHFTVSAIGRLIEGKNSRG